MISEPAPTETDPIPRRVDAVRPVRRATLIGGSAVLMWSTLALLTTMTGRVPPFLLVALAFTVAFATTVGVWLLRGGGIARRFRWPWRVWLLGVGGLFGYHFFYFFALRTAPPRRPAWSTIFGHC
jgi:drug/metabolite transporter (DMT)-like permease